jgi:hypothetical protein
VAVMGLIFFNNCIGFVPTISLSCWKGKASANIRSLRNRQSVCVCVCVCVLVIQGRKGVLPYLNVDWFLTFAQRGV